MNNDRKICDIDLFDVFKVMKNERISKYLTQDLILLAKRIYLKR